MPRSPDPYPSPSSSPSPPSRDPHRAALVRDGVETTYVVRGDWPHSGDRWFGPQPPPGHSDVACLIDGPDTFQSMADAMDTAGAAGHFIVLLGWSLDHAFVIDRPRGRTFLDIVEEKARRGVAVRVLLYHNTDQMVLFDERGERCEEPHRVNVLAMRALNDLRLEKGLDVHCNFDDNTSGNIPLGRVLIETFHPQRAGIHAYGSHHHKVLLVNGREGLIAFCGGIDFDLNRVRALHDVQLRVTGDAAHELLQIAEQRWVTARDDGRLPLPSTLAVPPVTDDPASMHTPYATQVLQTVGTPQLRRKLPNTLWPAVRHAVRQASRFIYIEEQYFMSLELIEELVAAADRVRYILVLVPPIAATEHNTWNLRQQALRELLRLGGRGIERKISFFQHVRGDHECVHSKLLLFDDEYFIVGTANLNNRGFFLDSEVNIGVAERTFTDPEGPRRGAWHHAVPNLARRLRMALWQEHLGLPAAELFDAAGARAHWDLPPAGAVIEPLRVLNIKRYRETGRRYHEAALAWQRRKEAAVKLRLPFDEPPPLDPIPVSETALWWEAPYSDWAAFPTAEEQFVDPKQ